MLFLQSELAPNVKMGAKARVRKTLQPLSNVISILKTMKAQEKAVESLLSPFLLSGEQKTAVSTTVQRVHCPTCGSSAERYHAHDTHTVRTQCSRCDYLMVSCTKTGRVIESYAPSFSPSMLAAR